jgi:hypothetical protein
MQGTRALFIAEAGVLVGAACATIIQRVHNGAPASDMLSGPGLAAVLAAVAAGFHLTRRWSLDDYRPFESVWISALWLAGWYASGGSSSAPMAGMGSLWFIGLVASVFDVTYGGRRAALVGSVAALGCGLYGAWRGGPLGLVGLATYGALILISATVIGVSLAHLRTPAAKQALQPCRSTWQMYALIVLIALLFVVGGTAYVFWR